MSDEKQPSRYAFQDYPRGLSEDTPLDFHSPYGCSKGAAEQYVRDYARIYGIRSVCFRQSCIYGERQFGMEDQGWVAWFTLAALYDRQISIYGDGKQVRDILYVGDLVKAYEKCVESIDKTAGQIYNIGGGADNTISLLELVELLESRLNKKLSLEFKDWRPGDQPVYIGNTEKAEREFAFRPEVDPKQGVARLIDWCASNRPLFDSLGLFS